MDRVLTVAVLIMTLLNMACGGANEGDITPSPPTITLADIEKPTGSPRDGYITYDRDRILSITNSDPRYTDAIERAKKSVAQLIAMNDDQLRILIPPASTKRALMVHRKGCPVHGGGVAVYQPFGRTVDLAYPLQVRCPECGTVFPNRDFPDDGSGWIDDRQGSPTYGERYYFVGWFNHWFLYSLPAHIQTMGQLWFLTGEDVYAHSARVLLERFMEVYPDIDGKDLTYDGTDWGVYVKMTGTFWEGTILRNMVWGIELLLPTFEDEFIDAIHEKIYRPAFDAYRAKPAAGNWGNMWNSALAKFGTVMGDRGMLEYVLYDHPAAQVPTLDNQFMRDGFPYEASLSYASTYHGVARKVADAMGPHGQWVWDHPHLRSSYHSFAELMIFGKYTHFAADMGGPVNNGWTLPVDGIRSAYQAYRTPELARYLLQAMELSGGNTRVSLDDLFREQLDMEEVQRLAASAPPVTSTISPLRGFAILRGGGQEHATALLMDYGFAHPAHSHADRLNMNFFAQGREFIPEMGYPEYMDHIAPATGGWTTHTVCHATVEVDEQRQLFAAIGDLHGFVEVDGLRYADASCEDAYAHLGVDMYRRTLTLLDTPGGSYAVDLFRVRGGSRHDYLFHGPMTDAVIDGVTLPAPLSGTMAGTDVPFGYKPDNVAPYGIENSGYQYLYDVREAAMTGVTTARWKMDDGVTFAARFIPDGEERLYHTLGYPRPASKSIPPMPFLIRHRDPSVSGDLSAFVTVFGVEAAPRIERVERLELSPDSTPGSVAVVVTHEYGRDVLLMTPSPDGRIFSEDGMYELTGQFGAVREDGDKTIHLTMTGGSLLRAGEHALKAPSPQFTARIEHVYDDRIVLDKPLPAGIAGDIVFADRGGIRSAYRIDKLDGRTVSISPTTWIGRGRVESLDIETGEIVDGRSIYRLADVSGQPHADKLRNYYSGAWVVPEGGGKCYRVSRGERDRFFVDMSQDLSGLEKNFPPGGTFLVYDVGPGDTVSGLVLVQGDF